MAYLSPSILSADFGNLQRDIEMINNSEADWFHVDVMDGVFVPNISFGFPIMSVVQKHAKKPIDIHLMIENPDSYIKTFASYGADFITIHAEASTHLHRSIQLIKDSGAKAGVALNPHTPISMLDCIIQDIDLVLIMSVNPGFGGQQFIHQTFHKLQQVKHLAQRQNAHPIIEVDGGVNLKNCQSLIAHGATALVAGSAVFNTPYPSETIAEFKALLND